MVIVDYCTSNMGMTNYRSILAEKVLNIIALFQHVNRQPQNQGVKMRRRSWYRRIILMQKLRSTWGKHGLNNSKTFRCSCLIADRPQFDSMPHFGEGFFFPLLFGSLSGKVLPKNSLEALERCIIKMEKPRMQVCHLDSSFLSHYRFMGRIL